MTRTEAIEVLTEISTTHARNWLGSAYNPNLDGTDRLAAVSRETLATEYREWLDG